MAVGPLSISSSWATRWGRAARRADGWLAMITTGTAGMSFFDSVEVDELRHPVLVTERRLCGLITREPGRFAARRHRR